MRKKTIILFSILALCMITCRLSGPAGKMTEVRIDSQLTGSIYQVISRAPQTFVGTLTATNLENAATLIMPWYTAIDEDTFSATSTNTVNLEPGRYDFSLVLTRGDHQYAGQLSDVTIYDGENNITFTLHPVIGDTLGDINLSQVASIEFEYPALELSAITEPKLGYIIDSENEVVLSINKTTGLSTSYVNIEPGNHTIRLKLYDGTIQIGKSMTQQETIDVQLTNMLKMDIIPLHSELDFFLPMEGSDAHFIFTIPGEVKDETGGINNLAVTLVLTSPVNGLQENELLLTENANGSVTGEITYAGFQYDTVSLALTFKDRADDEVIGYATIDTIVLHNNQVTLSMDMELRRRALAGGNLLGILGINVTDETGAPFAGAEVYLNDELKGITGSGTFGTPGYLKLYLTAGNYTIEAKTPGFAGTQSLAIAPLDIRNVTIQLSPAPVDFIYVVGTRSNGSNNDWWIKKFDSMGNEDTVHWNKIMDRDNSTETPRRIIIDSGYNVYVGGDSMGPRSYDWWIKKFDYQGQEDTVHWNQFISGSSGRDFLYDMALGKNGNIYCAGSAETSSYDDWWIRRFDPDGNPDPAWNIVLNFGTKDAAHAIAVDSNNDVYIAGDYQRYRWIIKKYTPGGNEITANWNKMYEGSPGAQDYDIPYTICIDGNDNVYVGGFINANSTYNWWIKKHDSAGNEDTVNWDKTFMNTLGNDSIYSSAVDSKNNVYFAGYRSNGTNLDWWIKKFDPEGNEDPGWDKIIDGGAGDDCVYSIKVDSQDNVYAAGYAHNGTYQEWWIKKFDEYGNEDMTWNKRYSGPGDCAAFDIGISGM